MIRDYLFNGLRALLYVLQVSSLTLQVIFLSLVYGTLKTGEFIVVTGHKLWSIIKSERGISTIKMIVFSPVNFLKKITFTKYKI